MATLPTNLKDDILDASVNQRRRYNMITNPDGTVEFEDVTVYSQVGSEYGAGLINETNKQINGKVDDSKIVRDLKTIGAMTQEGFIPDALALKEVNESLAWWIAKGYLPDPNTPNLYLYDDGNLCTDATGGWGINSTNDGSVTFNTNNVYLYTNTGNAVANIATKNAIDFTKYRKLKVKMHGVGHSTYGGYWFGISTTYQNAIDALSNPKVKVYNGSQKGTFDTILVEFDISDVSGSYYFNATSYYSNIYIEEIWLEP